MNAVKERSCQAQDGVSISVSSIPLVLVLMDFEMLAKLFDETPEKKEPLVVW